MTFNIADIFSPKTPASKHLCDKLGMLPDELFEKVNK